MTPRGRGRGIIKESATLKEPDKKGRDSKKNRRRSLLRVSSMSECSEATQDHHQLALELKRSQRQGRR